jgi:hypothetical protein
MAKINQIANRCPKTNLSFVVLPEDKEWSDPHHRKKHNTN